MKTFRLWMDRMGFNGKQMTQALDAIGISYRSSRAPRFQNDELTSTELLAMSAARAGLKPWSPETDPELVLVHRYVEALDGSISHEPPPSS